MWFGWSKHSHRGLRFWMMRVLQSGPRNGAEIMDTMEAMTKGKWRPSPGSVYPLLESMSKDGWVKRLEDGRYELTQQGLDQLSWPMAERSHSARNAEEVVDQIGNYISYLEDLNKVDQPQVAALTEKLSELRRRLAAVGGG